jgi:hypothetical protein
MRPLRIPNPRTALTILITALPFADSPRSFKAPLGLAIDPRNQTELIRAAGIERSGEPARSQMTKRGAVCQNGSVYRAALPGSWI